MRLPARCSETGVVGRRSKVERDATCFQSDGSPRPDSRHSSRKGPCIAEGLASPRRLQALRDQARSACETDFASLAQQASLRTAWNGLRHGGCL